MPPKKTTKTTKTMPVPVYGRDADIVEHDINDAPVIPVTAPPRSPPRSPLPSNHVNEIDVIISPVAEFASAKAQSARNDFFEESTNLLVTPSSVTVKPLMARSLSAQLSDDEGDIMERSSENLPFFNNLSDDDDDIGLLGDVVDDLGEALPERDVEALPMFTGLDMEADASAPVVPMDEWHDRNSGTYDKICYNCSMRVDNIMAEYIQTMAEFPMGWHPLKDELPATQEDTYIARIFSDVRICGYLMQGCTVTQAQKLDLNMLKDYDTFKRIEAHANENFDFTAQTKAAIKAYKNQKGDTLQFISDPMTFSMKPTGLKSIKGRLSYQQEQEADKSWSVTVTKDVPQDITQEIEYGVTLQDIFATTGSDMLFSDDSDSAMKVFNAIYMQKEADIIKQVNDRMRKWLRINYLNSMYMSADIMVMQGILAKYGISYGHLPCRAMFLTSTRLAAQLKIVNAERLNRSILTNRISPNRVVPERTSNALSLLEDGATFELFVLDTPTGNTFAQGENAGIIDDDDGVAMGPNQYDDMGDSPFNSDVVATDDENIYGDDGNDDDDY